MAITVTKENVVIGAAATLTLGSADLGATLDEPIVASFGQEFFDVKVGQGIGVIDKKLTGRKVTIAVPLAEADIANVHIALNLAAAALSASTIELDDSVATASDLIIAATAPNSGTRTYTFDEVLQVGNVDLSVGKNETQNLTLLFEALWQTGTGQFGTIVDA